MIKISATIITFNEEKNIERCLKSLQGVADEIIVVDSYSSDNTKDICEKYCTKFIEHKFEGHIQQKNWAITQAKYTHILSLDADEVLSNKLIESIIKAKKKWDCDGYYFNRLTNYCGKWIKHSGWYPDRKLRLFDSRKGKWGGINPHDKYEMKNDSAIKFIKGDLYHYSYLSINQHIAQINKFSEIGAMEIYKRGKKSNLIKIIVKPTWKFIYHFFIRLGFLDGYYGFVISIHSAYGQFLKHIKLKQLYKDAR